MLCATQEVIKSFSPQKRMDLVRVAPDLVEILRYFAKSRAPRRNRAISATISHVGSAFLDLFRRVSMDNIA